MIQASLTIQSFARGYKTRQMVGWRRRLLLLWQQLVQEKVARGNKQHIVDTFLEYYKEQKAGATVHENRQ
eukprot:9537225-Prorocentrum_lima.AAC.1